MNNWIKVEDRLPKDLQVVLCAFQIGEPLVLTYIIGDDVGRFYMDFKPCNYCEDFTALVTHWQPLPTPPYND